MRISEDYQKKLKENNKNKFRENLKFQEDTEKLRLLQLQKQFEQGEIEEKDIPYDDIQKLHKLYDEQIAKIEKSTENYKKRILEIRKKIGS